MGRICTEKTYAFCTEKPTFSALNSLALSPTSWYSYGSQLLIDEEKLLPSVFGDTTIHKNIFSLCFCLVLSYLSHYVHINTSKVNILKSCPRLVLYLFLRGQSFFSSLFQETITALIYLPGIKCWWVPVSSGWHLFHQRSRSGGDTEGREEKRAACIPSQRMWWNC